MSLLLFRGTQPSGLNIKTHGVGTKEIVCLGDYEISMDDFLIAAEYVLTNTDLKADDPRLQFVKCVQSMKKIPGHNADQKRLRASKPPV